MENSLRGRLSGVGSMRKNMKEDSEKLPSEKPNNRSGVGKRFTTYMIATRPWSFSASFTPVLLGTALASTELNNFSLSVFLLTVLCVISVHCAGNLVNTFYDFRTGVDKETSDDKTLVLAFLKPDDVARLGAVSYGAGCVAFVALIFVSKACTEYLSILFFTGLSGSFLYTGSIGLKYHALGDIVIILIFGPVSVLFAFVVQTGVISWSPLFYSLPLVLNTEAILHGNNSRDCDEDAKAGILTVAIILGKCYSYVLYFVLLFLPYQIMVVLSVIKSKYFLMPLFTVPFALALEEKFRKRDMTLLPQETAKLNLLFGLLYVIVFFFFD